MNPHYLHGITDTLHGISWLFGAATITAPTALALLATWRSIRRPLDRLQLTLRARYTRRTGTPH